MTRTLTRLAAAAALISLATPAFAHTGHHAAGFAAGLAHPFSGLDHLLAMAGIGVWAAQLGGHNRWRVPLAFVGTMLLGAGLALVGFPLPQVGLGIAGSVIAIGLLVGLGTKLPNAAAIALAALVALFHGHAHGTELPTMASAWNYGMGFVLATSLLHMAGLGLGHIAFRTARPVLLKLAGLATALAGGVLVAGI
ncbi:MAG: HupE/UreJ family protein [Rhodospirillaceae bacterium]|nr:HupE/UreJ family protein [Rhodospirillaceae bacterium]